MVEVPVVTKTEYLVVDIDNEGFLSLFDVERGETKDDLKCPEAEVGEKTERIFKRGGKDVIVVVVGAMGGEMVDDVKEVDRK